ncbi:MAG: hypothetical protein JNK05_08840 [Myxococcales bacterium]|nr:hypothetical protein [Myxococcales bacterium]
MRTLGAFFSRSVLPTLSVFLLASGCVRPRVEHTPAQPTRPRAISSQDTWIAPTESDPRGTDTLADLTRSPAALLEDGTFVLLAPDGSPAFAALTRENTLRSQTPHAVPAPRCAISPAGNGVLRLCAGATEGDANAWWIDRSQVVALPAPVSSRAISDVTGDGVAFDGRCNPSEPDDGSTFCWLRRDQLQWREWSAPNRATLLALRGESALLSEAGDLRATLAHFDVNTSRRRVVEHTDPTLDIDAATFGPNGDVIVLSHRTGRDGAIESFACVASLGSPCTARALHIHAMDIAFADTRHGLAVGAHANELSITTDGGASWSPITPTGHPAPASVALPTPPIARSSRRLRIRPASTVVRCNVRVCVAGRLVHRWPDD